MKEGSEYVDDGGGYHDDEEYHVDVGMDEHDDADISRLSAMRFG